MKAAPSLLTILFFLTSGALAETVLLDGATSRELTTGIEASFNTRCGDTCEIEFGSLNCAVFPVQGLACAIYSPKLGTITTKYGEAVSALHKVVNKITDKQCPESICKKPSLTGSCKKEYKSVFNTTYACTLKESKKPPVLLTSEYFK